SLLLCSLTKPGMRNAFTISQTPTKTSIWIPAANANATRPQTNKRRIAASNRGRFLSDLNAITAWEALPKPGSTCRQVALDSPPIFRSFLPPRARAANALANAKRPSHVQRPAICVEHALLHHLRKRGMREDGMHEFFFRRLQIHRDDEALDELGDLRPHHVRAQKLSRLCIEYGLDQSLVLAEGDGLAVGGKRKAADTYVAARFPCLRLGKPDRSDLGIAVG